MANQKKVKNRFGKDALKRKRIRKQWFVMGLLVLCLGGALPTRILYIKATYGDEFERNAIAQQVQRNNVDQYITPNRGTILDRNRSVQALAISTTVYNVIWDIRLITEEKPEVQANTIALLHQYLHIPTETLQEYLMIDQETGRPVIDRNYFVIYKNLDTKTKNQLEGEKPSHVYFEEDTERKYPNSTLASSVVGFVRGDTNWGIEAKYDSELTGVQGRVVRMYDQNNTVSTEKIAPVQGNTIITTLDIYIQQQAQAITEKYGKHSEAEHAALLVMNPNTGEILAMAQYPTFDLNDPMNIALVNSDTLKENFETMTDQERLDTLYGIWSNYTITSNFDPGSIYKPLVVAAALEEGVISTGDTFFCDGGIDIYDWHIPCWNTNGHGYLSLEEVLAKSCNMGMIEIINRLGKETYYSYQRGFGVGELTGVDLIGEVSNERNVHNLAGLGPVELAVASMGQGFSVTALQAINGFSAVINGGNLMKPYVVSQVVDADNSVIQEFEPEIQRKVISKEVSDWVRNAMKKTISPEGTGKNVMIDGYSIGGKSGTGQQGAKGEDSDEEYTLAFMAYFPADDPEYIIMSVINRPENFMEGNSDTMPMVRDLIMSIIQYNHILPQTDTDSPIVDLLYENVFVLEDYTERKISDVIRHLNYMKLDYEVTGSGNTVVSHMPPPGSKVSEGTKIYLSLEDTGGDDLVLVPNVTGMNRAQAEEALGRVGLIPVFITNSNGKGEAQQTEEGGDEGEASGSDASAVVQYQMPRYEVMLQTGTEIKLYLE